MKDFNSYIPDDDDKDTKGFENSDALPQGAMDMVKNIAKKYHGKSQNEMLSAIFKEAEKGRKAGTLTNAEIDNFAAAISPFIDSEKKKKLDSILKQLKKD